MTRSTLARTCAWITALALLSAAPSFAQTPLTPAFTYQGQLKDNGQPADGQFDFIFELVNAATGGNLIGGQQLISNVPVSEGLFTVQLNGGGEFGPDAFNGQARWLGIWVKPSGGFFFEPLSPRQPLMAAPYTHTAVRALSVPGIDGHSLDSPDGSPVNALIVDNDGKVGIGAAAPAEKLSVAGTVESTSGGFKFPDGTRQRTAMKWAFVDGGSDVSLTTSWQTIRSITISVNGPGTMLVTASGIFGLGLNSSNQVVAGVSMQNNGFPANAQTAAAILTSSQILNAPFTSQHALTVGGPGTFTFYLVGIRNGSGGVSEITPTQMSALFIPASN